jgi:hypothetical protein
MIAPELVMFEIIATANGIGGIELQGIYPGTQSSLEVDVLATPAISYVPLYVALRDLGLTPVVKQQRKLDDGIHSVQLMIDVMPTWHPPT